MIERGSIIISVKNGTPEYDRREPFQSEKKLTNFSVDFYVRTCVPAHTYEVYPNQNAPVDVTSVLLIVQTFTLY